MYPVLFRIGNFPINTYGVFLALAFLCAILITVKLGERDGLPRQKLYDLSLWMLLASLIGSKILMFFTEPEYRDHPLQLLSLDFLRSGGVFYGGLLGAVLTGYFLMRRYKLPWWKTADACAPGIAIGNFFGRQGCFAAANDCEGIGVGNRVSHRERAPGVGIDFKDAHRPVPQNRLRILDCFVEQFDGGRADVEGVPPLRNLLDRDDLRFRPWLAAGRNDTIHRQVEFHATGKSMVLNAFREVQHVVFNQ